MILRAREEGGSIRVGLIPLEAISFNQATPGTVPGEIWGYNWVLGCRTCTFLVWDLQVVMRCSSYGAVQVQCQRSGKHTAFNFPISCVLVLKRQSLYSLDTPVHPPVPFAHTPCPPPPSTYRSYHTRQSGRTRHIRGCMSY